MKILNHIHLIVLTLMLPLIISNIQAANDGFGVKIVVKPNQCIALHQGQQCYVDIDLAWTAQHAGNYCLYSSQQKQALQCWNGKSKGTYKKEVVSSENINFTIRLNGLENDLATEVLKMAWVYRNNAQIKSAWRLF